MKVDSVHSSIDSQRKHLKVSSPFEWPVVLQMARRNNLYTICEVDQNELFDLYQLFSKVHARNLKFWK